MIFSTPSLFWRRNVAVDGIGLIQELEIFYPGCRYDGRRLLQGHSYEAHGDALDKEVLWRNGGFPCGIADYVRCWMAEVRPSIGIYVLTGVVRGAEAALEAIALM